MDIIKKNEGESLIIIMDLYDEIYHHPKYNPKNFFYQNVSDHFKNKIKKIKDSTLLSLCLAEILMSKKDEEDPEIIELLLNSTEYPLTRHYLSRIFMLNGDISEEDFCYSYHEMIKTGHEKCYESCLKIAAMYENGLCVDKDLNKALKWYLKAKKIKPKYFDNNKLMELKKK